MQRLPQIREANLSLISAFESHSAYASQFQQRQGKIYFMWDFAMRTEAMFQSILHNYPPPDTPATRRTIPNVPPSAMNDAQRDELEKDAVGRCMLLWTMITDTSPMSGIMFGEMPGQGVDLGDEVRRAAEAVNDVLSQQEQESETAQTSTVG